MQMQVNKADTSKKKLKRIVIVGQGAMGLLWYHHLKTLSKTDNRLEVTLKPSKNIKNLKKNYQFTPYQLPHSHEIKESLSGVINYADSSSLQQADVVIFCLKAYQVAQATNELNELLKSDTTLILAHNGMGTLSELSNDVRSRFHIASMLTTHGCLRSNENNITHTGLGESILGAVPFSAVPFSAVNATVDKVTKDRVIGNIRNHVMNDLKETISILNNALPQTKHAENILDKQWLKLAVNCVINPITAINNIQNGEVNNAIYRNTKNDLLNEVVAVANAEGIKLDLNFLVETVTNVALATAKNSSSMRCDVQEGRRTEIDYINGYIHDLGLKNNIATPMNTLMWQQVLAK